MNQLHKIRITETDPETRDAVTTEFDDIDAAIEYLRGKRHITSVETEETVDGSQTTA